LKKGGEVVFSGELGNCSSNLITFFENLGANPINKGENPASEFECDHKCFSVLEDIDMNFTRNCIFHQLGC
jgi:hypothetical protein